MAYRFEVIAPHHDVGVFRSANVGVDTFLWHEALAETQADRVRTYILVDTMAPTQEAVAGFITLKAEGVWTTGLPSLDPPAYVPAVELCYLARHQNLRGQGIGDVLLSRVLRLTVEAAERIGIAGIYLYATSEGERLYNRFKFQSFGSADRRMFLPIEDARGYTLP